MLFQSAAEDSEAGVAVAVEDESKSVAKRLARFQREPVSSVNE